MTPYGVNLENTENPNPRPCRAVTPYHEMTTHGPNYHEPPPDIIDGEKEWEVKEIMGSRRYGRWKKLQYLIWWEGYSAAHDSWEPAERIHVPDLIQDFGNTLYNDEVVE